MSAAFVIVDLSNMPMMDPPNGQQPDSQTHETRARHIFCTAEFCLTMIVFFASIRVWAKVSGVIPRKILGDVIFAASVIGTITFIIMLLVASSGGSFGKHAWNIRLRDFDKEELVFFLLSESLYSFFLFLVKLSVFVLYLEFFGRIEWLRYSAYAGIGLLSSFYLVCVIFYGVSCGPPISKQSAVDYILALAGPRCATIMPLLFTQGVVNLLSDVYLMIIPIPAVWSLKLPIRKKLGLSAMFLVGCCAVVASAYALHGRTILVHHWTDSTWNVIPVWIGSMIEMTAGIMVCCMPACMAVFRHFKRKIQSWKSSRKAQNSESNSGRTSSNSNRNFLRWHGQEKGFGNNKTYMSQAWSALDNHHTCEEHQLRNCSRCLATSSRKSLICKTTEIEIVRYEV